MTTGDVHVGDVGTTYKAKIQDNGVALDPTSAVTKVLVFQTPTGTVQRAASVLASGGEWYLTYTLTALADATFHARQGLYRWQGVITFADGQHYSTSIETYIVRDNL